MKAGHIFDTFINTLEIETFMMTPNQQNADLERKEEHLTLKWGTLKSWDFHSEKALELLKEYGEIGSSFSAIAQHDTPRQKEILCELIDVGNFKGVYLDWDGKYVSKKKAKKYVMDY